MKKYKQLTEHYLLPLNLCFISFFAIFFIYELDKNLILKAQESSSTETLIICGLTTAILASSIKFRNRYFHILCIFLSLISLAILIWQK
tara:strand:- start:894 stop:1160 length:267 start_codon:yes stop_codon:yes gene_type:complete